MRCEVLQKTEKTKFYKKIIKIFKCSIYILSSLFVEILKISLCLFWFFFCWLVGLMAFGIYLFY